MPVHTIKNTKNNLFFTHSVWTMRHISNLYETEGEIYPNLRYDCTDSKSDSFWTAILEDFLIALYFRILEVMLPRESSTFAEVTKAWLALPKWNNYC